MLLQRKSIMHWVAGSVLEEDASYPSEDHSQEMNPNEIRNLISSLQKLLSKNEASLSGQISAPD